MAETQPKPKGLAVASMVCGICGIAFIWAVHTAIVLEILAIVFGGVAIAKARKREADGKGMAIAGLVCGCVGLVVTVVVITLVTQYVFTHWDEIQEEFRNEIRSSYSAE